MFGNLHFRHKGDTDFSVIERIYRTRGSKSAIMGFRYWNSVASLILKDPVDHSFSVTLQFDRFLYLGGS